MHKDVTPELAGLKLDQVLTRLYPELSRKTARQALITGRVRLNGKVVKIIARTVKAGDRIFLGDAGVVAVAAPARQTALRIVHEEREWLIIDKPGALLSERVEGEKGEAVADVLQRMGKGRTWLVHRLDAGTSGVMIVARSEAAAAHFNDAFKQGLVEKSYLLLCIGVPGQGEYAQPLGRDPKHPRRFAVRVDGKRAATRYKTLASAGELSLANARPETGRTHQIRVHFAAGGHPLLGDRMYGGPGRKDTTLFDRPLLHAWAVAFEDPAGKHRRFVVTPPEDFLHVQQAFGLSANFDLLDPLW